MPGIRNWLSLGVTIQPTTLANLTFMLQIIVNWASYLSVLVSMSKSLLWLFDVLSMILEKIHCWQWVAINIFLKQKQKVYSRLPWNLQWEYYRCEFFYLCWMTSKQSLGSGGTGRKFLTGRISKELSLIFISNYLDLHWIS